MPPAINLDCLARIPSVLPMSRDNVLYRLLGSLIRSSVLVSFFISIPAALALTNPLDYWTWSNPKVSGNILYDIAYGNGTYVAVGDWGTVLVSQDGANWRTKSLPVSTVISCVTFGNGIFVAYALDPASTAIGNSTSYILTSADGENWNVVFSQANYSIYGRTTYIRRVFWMNGMFIAVGGNNSFVNEEKECWILTSPDGTNWTTRVSGPGMAMYSVVYAQNKFVALGNNGSSLISQDGIAWTTNATGLTTEGVDVLYWNGRFAALYNTSYFQNPSWLVMSTDGTNWAGPANFSGWLLRRLTIYGTNLLATGENGVTYITPDGTNWSQIALPITNSYAAKTFGNRTFLVGGQGTILSGTPGQSWTSFPSALGGFAATAMAFDGNRFVTMGPGNNSIVASSSDGRNWFTNSLPPASSMNALIYTNGTFVAVGSGHRIVTSTNGISWQVAYENPAGSELQGVAFANGLFVAVGWYGYTLTSPDGISWTSHKPLSDFLMGVTSGNGLFVAHEAHAILTSTDGVNWTTQTNVSAVSNAMLKRGAYGAGRFVLMDELGASWVSTNGADWTRSVALTDYPFRTVIFTGTSFVAAGDGPLVFESSDGLTWASHFLPCDSTVMSLAFGCDTIVAGTSTGLLLQSDPLHGPLQTIRSTELRNGNRLHLDITAPIGTVFELQKTTGLSDKWKSLGYFSSPVGRMTYEEQTTNAATYFRAVPQ